MKSIIFSGESVQAILDGRKTQTRRVVRFDRPPPENGEKIIDSVGTLVVRDGQTDYKAKPLYTLGDILYVKETWGTYKKDWQESDRILYRADYPDGLKGYWHEPEQINWIDLPKWRSPMFMPEEASRLHIRITDMKAERLHQISLDECRLEGCCSSDCYQTGKHSDNCKCDTRFINTWDSLHAKDGNGWSFNPYVWVYTFERTEKE